jgi:hypothetical protein
MGDHEQSTEPSDEQAEQLVEPELLGSIWPEHRSRPADREVPGLGNLMTYVIWSDSGQCVMLTGPGGDSGAFAPGSSFLVLDVEHAMDGSGAAVVFLAERRARSANAPEGREKQILWQLKRQLARTV